MTARHEWLDRWCGWLEKCLHGRDAAALAQQLPGRALVVCLPMWTWQVSKHNVGKKGTSQGQPVLMPVRLYWGERSVLFAEPGQKLSWRTTSGGWDVHGDVQITPTGALSCSDDAFGIEVASHVAAHRVPAGLLGQWRQNVVAEGQQAFWLDVMPALERMLSRSVSGMHDWMSRDVNLGQNDSAAPLLDETAMEAIRDGLLLGEHGSSSPAVKLVSHSMDPFAFTRVDPQRYIAVAVRRAAAAALRERLDDPDVGPRIRSVWRAFVKAHGREPDTHEVIEHLRLDNPHSDIGAARVVRALSIAPDPMASALPLLEEAL